MTSLDRARLAMIDASRDGDAEAFVTARARVRVLEERKVPWWMEALFHDEEHEMRRARARTAEKRRPGHAVTQTGLRPRPSGGRRDPGLPKLDPEIERLQSEIAPGKIVVAPSAGRVGADEREALARAQDTLGRSYHASGDRGRAEAEDALGRRTRLPSLPNVDLRDLDPSDVRLLPGGKWQWRNRLGRWIDMPGRVG